MPAPRRSRTAGLGGLVRRARPRLEAGTSGFAEVLREALDPSSVLRRAGEHAHEVLGTSTAVWHRAGGDTFGCVHTVGTWPDADGRLPAVVAKCITLRRVQVDPITAEAAAPISGSATGVLGALHVAGRALRPEALALLGAIARETGHALDAVELSTRALEAEAQARTVLDAVASAVVVTDLGGVVRQSNPAARRLVGAERDIVGERCEAALALRDGDLPLDCSAGCPLLGDDDPLGRNVCRGAGTDREQRLLATAEVVRDRSGNPVAVVHSLRDVTRLRQADEAKTLFLATATHELKTPITVIKGFAEMLEADPAFAATEAGTAATRAIAQRARELATIVERLLLTSRIEAGHVEVAPEPVDLAPLLAERAAAIESATGHGIEIDVEPGLPEAYADPAAVVTIVEHLLDNAAKYSPGGGTIELGARAVGRAVEIRIVDQGLGMADDQLAHCWDKFWQGDTSESRRFGGTGIGLYIVRSLAEAMGGRVAVSSRLGVGSTFAVQLPLASAGDEPVAAPAPGRADPSVIREFMRQVGIRERRS